MPSRSTACSSAPRASRRSGAGAHVFAHLAGEPVAVEQGRAIATSFHPELAGETRVHERFLERVRTAGAARV